jgi:hypothetical protein
VVVNAIQASRAIGLEARYVAEHATAQFNVRRSCQVEARLLGTRAVRLALAALICASAFCAGRAVNAAIERPMCLQAGISRRNVGIAEQCPNLGYGNLMFR